MLACCQYEDGYHLLYWALVISGNAGELCPLAPWLGVLDKETPTQPGTQVSWVSSLAWGLTPGCDVSLLYGDGLASLSCVSFQQDL